MNPSPNSDNNPPDPTDSGGGRGPAIKQSGSPKRTIIGPGSPCRSPPAGNGPSAVRRDRPQLRFVEVNQAFAEFVGYSRQELHGMSTLDLTAPQSVDRTRGSHAEVLASGKDERVVKNYRRKDGGLVPVELIVDAYRDESGKPLGLDGFITDISQRIKVETASRAPRALSRALRRGSGRLLRDRPGA